MASGNPRVVMSETKHPSWLKLNHSPVIPLSKGNMIEMSMKKKADRLKNGEVVEENYVNHCITKDSSPKNGQD